MKHSISFLNVGLVIFLLLVQAGGAFAQNTYLPLSDPDQAAEQLAARRQALEEEQQALERARRQLSDQVADLPRKLNELQVGQVSELLLEQARLDAQTAQLRQEYLQLEIANAEQRIRELKQSIRFLEARQQLLKNPAKVIPNGMSGTELQSIKQALAQQRDQLELEKAGRDILRQMLGLALQRQPLIDQWRARVEEIYRLQQEQDRRIVQQALEQQLRQTQQAHLTRAEELRERLASEQGTLSEADRRLLELQIRAAEAQGRLLVEQDLRLVWIKRELARLEGLLQQADVWPRALHEGLDRLRALQQEFTTAESLFQRAIALAEQQIQVIEQVQESADPTEHAAAAKTISELVEGMEHRRAVIETQRTAVEDLRTRLEAAYEASISRDLLDRHPLPATTAQWRQLLEGLIEAPRVLVHQVRLSLETAAAAMADSGVLPWLGLVILELGLLGVMLWARRDLGRAVSRASAQKSGLFLRDFSLILLLLIQRNLMGIGLTLALLLVVWVVQVPQPGLGIIVTLALLWVDIKIPITLARLLFTSLPPERRHTHLYRQLSGSILVGGFLAAITVLAHLSALDGGVSGLLDRLFMLYLLLMFILMLRLRGVLREQFTSPDTDRLGITSWRLPSLLLVMSLPAVALVGLTGYLNLAWAMAWHLGIFGLALVAWLFVRSLLKDLAVWLKNYAVTHSAYALLWTQEVINPLHRLLKVVLFLGFWMALFQVYGWYGESAAAARLWEVMDGTLFTLGGAPISLWGILVTGLSVLGVIWLGRWGRTVTYRWVFSRITDLGMRNSLSVFLQYAVVLIGLLLILRTLGLDLTTLTVLAGAIGVGIGFGMQAIANNFISGLMLLIERPLRSGDIVKIGTHEGTVSRIGIRSLTVKTFDNLEVIIPNGEVVNNSFTNWTHSDNIIRSVIIIGISYDDDPDRVRALLESTVQNHPAVLKEPRPLVLLWEFADSSLLFRVQFYSDVTASNVLQVRSEIRSSIWYTLREAGVHIPYPQQDIHVREWPGEWMLEKSGRKRPGTQVVEPLYRKPAVDVFDRDGAIVVRAQLPGVHREDMNVSVSDTSVTLSGRARLEEEGQTYHHREMDQEAFLRSVDLPAVVEGTAAKATFKDGVLELWLPKREEVRSYALKVENA